MNITSKFTKWKRVTALALLTAFAVGTSPVPRMQAAPAKGAAPSSQRHQKNKIASDIAGAIDRTGRADIILQLNGPVTGRLKALLHQQGIKVKKQLAKFDMFAVQLPASVISELVGHLTIS